jgi:hypothetical protein
MPQTCPTEIKERKKSESKAAESSRYNMGYMQKRKEESWKKSRQKMQKQKSPTQPKPKPESIPSKSDLLGAKPVPFHSPPTRKPRSLTNQRRKGTGKKEKPKRFQKRPPYRDISVRHEGRLPRQSFPLSDTSFPCLRLFWSAAATKPICKTQFVSTSRRKSD